MELSELFTERAQQVLPQARAKGLISYFDYHGPFVDVGPQGQALKAGMHRVLLGITDCTESGFLLLSARADAPVRGHSEILISAAASGDMVSTAAMAHVLRRLSLRREPAWSADMFRASGRCPATGGWVEFRDAGAEGLLLTLSLKTPAVEIADNDFVPDAAGAAAWLVASDSSHLFSVERRLKRLGWRVRTFESIDDVTEALAVTSSRPPLLLVAAESEHVTLEQLTPLGDAHPAMWCVLAVLSGSRTITSSAHSPVHVRILPLSPLELEQFTARVDARTSTPALLETSPSPLFFREARTILLVDDNDINQVIVRAQLELLGYDVLIAADGQQALTLCELRAPDLVLMDLDMPVMGGLEATHEIVARQAAGTLPPFPIVAATGVDNQSRRTACFQAGMQGYLVKPLPQPVLAAELKRLLPARPVAHS